MSGYSLASSINKLRSSSFILFIIFLLVIYLAMVIGVYTIFPTQNTFPHLARNGIMAFLVIIFIITSKRLLKRDSFAPDLLDLSISTKSLILFFFGGGISILIIASMAGLLWLLVPYHFELQELSTPYILKELHSYFWNNFMEELMFRGYPLIVLSSKIGWRRAVLVMALPFGLSHLPGLSWNIAAVKMILTSSTFSLIFCYAFILTGSLWTSIGLHVIGNFLLHTITGLDGSNKALLKPVFIGTWPETFDPGLAVFLFVVSTLALLLYFLCAKKELKTLVLTRNLDKQPFF